MFNIQMYTEKQRDIQSRYQGYRYTGNIHRYNKKQNNIQINRDIKDKDMKATNRGIQRTEINRVTEISKIILRLNIIKILMDCSLCI